MRVRAGGLGLWKGGMLANVWVDFGGIWWTGVKGIGEWVQVGGSWLSEGLGSDLGGGMAVER